MKRIRLLNTELLQRYEQAAATIAAALPPPFDAVVISGSGIADAIPQENIRARLSYTDIPGLAPSSVLGHRSEVMAVRIGTTRVLVFGGRFHLYEGYALAQVVAPVLIAHLMGIPNAVLTNAAGGLNPSYRAGDIMLADDLINATTHTLIRESSDTNTQMQRQHTYCNAAWKSRIAQALCKRGTAYQQGNYLALTGPTYETRAEVGYYRKQADAIGMSTVHEAQCAVQLGMKVSVCSTITNVLSDTRIHKVTHDEVIETAAVAQHKIRTYIELACITTEQNSGI